AVNSASLSFCAPTLCPSSATLLANQQYYPPAAPSRQPAPPCVSASPNTAPPPRNPDRPSRRAALRRTSLATPLPPAASIPIASPTPSPTSCLCASAAAESSPCTRPPRSSAP